MAKHIWINPARFQKLGKEVQVDGIDLQVQLSPFSRPNGVRGEYQRKTKCFVIRFDYIDAEPDGAPSVHRGIRFIPGKHSGKLLAIEIPIAVGVFKSAALIQLQTEVVAALKDQSSQFDPEQNDRGTWGKYLNWEAAREVLEDESEFNAVAGELVGA
ncbi:MAG: hypothetical protein ACK5Q5_03065 [Planctomycetaceae bacterium]